MNRTWKLKTIADTPFGTYPPYPVGPAIVQNDDWNTSCMTGTHIEGAKISAFRVITENPYTTERHELDGQTFPNTETARRAQYEAGMIAYMVYDDSEWADKPEDKAMEEIMELLKPTHAKVENDTSGPVIGGTARTVNARGEAAVWDIEKAEGSWWEVSRRFTVNMYEQGRHGDWFIDGWMRVEEFKPPKPQEKKLKAAVAAVRKLAKAYDCTMTEALELLEEETTCQGHESLDGPIGNLTYCDGTCR